MIQEEIARLTGTLKFNVDNRPLLAFQNRLNKVKESLSEFSAIANKKFNVKVALDAKSLRAQLDRAANTKVVFRNFAVDVAALDVAQAHIKQKLDSTRINLKNIKINMSETIAQRAALRDTLGRVGIEVNVLPKVKEAERVLRAWKKATEEKFKLHLKADISRSTLLRNARASLKYVSENLRDITISGSKIRLSVDRKHLRSEIQSVLAQIRREVGIRIHLDTRLSGGGGYAGGGSRVASSHAAAGFAGGLASGGMGLARGFLPGLGTAYAIAGMNRINQEMQAAGTALQAVSGNAEEYADNMKFLNQLADEQGRNFRDIAPQFTSVLASARESIGSKGTQDVFRGLLKYGTVMGLDQESMKGSMRAISQMFSKDKIQAEEAQGQLAERLPAAMQLLAKANGTDVPGLRAAMQKGALDPKVILPQMAKIMEDLASDSYARALASTRVQQGRMGRQFEKSVKIFADNGFDAAMSKFFKTMADGMERAEPAVKALGGAFSVVMEVINAGIRIITRLGERWNEWSEGLGITRKQLALLPLLFFPVISAIGLLILAIDDLMTYNEGGISLFGKWLEEKPGAIKAFEEMKAAIKEFKETWSGLFTSEGNDSFKSSVEWLDQAIKNINFSDMFLQTIREIKMLFDLMTATINKLTGANEFSRRVSSPDAPEGGAEQGFNFVTGLTHSDEWKRREIQRRVNEGTLDAKTPEEIQARNDYQLARGLRAGTLPGINTPLAGGEYGEVPSSQAPMLTNGMGPTTNVQPGAIQIQIMAQDPSDPQWQGKVKEVIRSTLQEYQPKEVK